MAFRCWVISVLNFVLNCLLDFVLDEEMPRVMNNYYKRKIGCSVHLLWCIVLFLPTIYVQLAWMTKFLVFVLHDVRLRARDYTIDDAVFYYCLCSFPLIMRILVQGK
jgi:hypothetical protein